MGKGRQVRCGSLRRVDMGSAAVCGVEKRRKNGRMQRESGGVIEGGGVIWEEKRLWWPRLLERSSRAGSSVEGLALQGGDCC